MVFYEGIVGSRSCNLQTEKSDFDFLCCASEENETTYNPNNYPSSHLLFNDPSSFFQRMTGRVRPAILLQNFFPCEFVSSTPLSEYLVQNREEILRAMGNELYRIYSWYGEYVKNLNPKLPCYRKKLMYSLLFTNLLIEYPKGQQRFEDLFLATGTRREQLLEIKHGGKAEEKIALQQLNELREELLGLKEVYAAMSNKKQVEAYQQDLRKLLML